MISAFKHIRLSGYNLTPVQGTAWDNSSALRLGFGNSGLAYYSELTGISGYLQGLINTANADVNSINVTGYVGQGNLAITGLDGVKLTFNTQTNTIEVNGNSGYFQQLSNQISSDLATTGSTLYNLLIGFSGGLDVSFASQSEFNALSGNLVQTGFILDSKINSLSGYVNSQNTLFSGQIALTGSILDTKINNYSGWANATYVAKSSNQVFRSTLAPGLDSYAIIYPVPFVGTPKVQATLEVPGEVMYNLSVRSVDQNGYTGVLSDNIAESPVYIHTFASTQ
jgi:hypothetical protein